MEESPLIEGNIRSRSGGSKGYIAGMNATWPGMTAHIVCEEEKGGSKVIRRRRCFKCLALWFTHCPVCSKNGHM